MTFSKRILSSLFVFLAVVFLASGVAMAAEKRYVVKKNDTLTDIARRHGISLKRLMQFNRLSQPNRIFPGDVLRIPDQAASPGAARFDAALQRQLDRVRIVPNRWKYIVIHHSATDSGTLKGMDRYHRQQGMENGLAYHFVIGNGRGMEDGEIAIGSRWLEQLQGGHLASESLNVNSIGICLVGNFEARKPTARQLASLHTLADYLMELCRLKPSALKTHQQINPVHTRCPGRHFPAKSVFSDLAKR